MRKRGPRRLPRPAHMERVIRFWKKSAESEYEKYTQWSNRERARHIRVLLATEHAYDTYMKEMGVHVDAARVLDLYSHYYEEYSNKQHANKQRKHK